MNERAASSKSVDAYRTISEVAEDLGLPQHVLRFWETRFPQVKPLKRAGGRRFYRPEDVELLRAVKALLYDDGYTIKGVQRMLRDQGPKAIKAFNAASPSAPRGGTEEARMWGGEASDTTGELSAALAIPGGRAERLVSELDEEMASVGSTPGPASRPRQALPTDIVDRLQAVLRELAACERLIGQAPSFPQH